MDLARLEVTPATWELGKNLPVFRIICVDRSNMKLAAVLLCVLALSQVATPQLLCQNTCPTPDGQTVCAYNGCYFNTELCTMKIFNCHRKGKGMSVIKVVSEGPCNNETQIPYCLTVTL